MIGLQIEDLVQSRGGRLVLDHISFEIERGAFCVILGPSGCGKSTLLRTIAGLERPDKGAILFDGAPITDLAPEKRGIGFVFQNFALYPHMTVFGNLSYGMRLLGSSRDAVQRRVSAVAEQLGLKEVLLRQPHQLSGGQQQRVAIGRAIIREPRLLLFDEPLSSLDAQLRVELRLELLSLHRRTGATSLFVSHDQADAFAMADKVIVLNKGHVDQSGTPQELYHKPATPFVAAFVGQPPMNLIAAVVREGGAVFSTGGLPLVSLTGHKPGPVWLGIRAENVTHSLTGTGLSVQVEASEFAGSRYLIHSRMDGGKISFYSQEVISPGTSVMVQFDEGARPTFLRKA